MSIKRLKKRAFTLIELLVVMAITAVMLTLIVTPLFQSINLTRNAQAFADAQDKGRLLTEKIAREVGNAVSVRDAASTMAQLPGNVLCELPYTKLDLIPPAQGSPDSTLPAGIFRNPDTGKIDPTMKRPLGDIRLPIAPGATIVRWWVGLNDPTRPYTEPYSGLLMVRSGERDNLYVLRRAEVQPFVYRIRKDGAANTEAWRPNLDFFHSDDFVSNNQEFDRRITDLDDKYFYVRDGLFHPENNGIPVNDPTVGSNLGKNDKVDKWTAASTVQTEVSRYDMVRPLLQGSPPQVVDKTKVVPLIQFRPSRMSSTPSSGTAAARPGLAIDGLDLIGPDTYQSERGLWTNAIIRYYPSGFPVSTGQMEVASVDAQGGINISNGGQSADGADGVADSPNNYELFDLKLYEQMIGRGQAYPFTQAALASDGKDLNVVPPYPGSRWTSVAAQRQIFTPFRVLTATGKLITSFPIEEVGTNLVPGGGPNLPAVGFNSTYAVSPTQAAASDPGLTAAPYSPVVAGYDPNRAFNRAWNAFPAYQGQLQRFIDLRMVPNLDGTYSPLNPIGVPGEVRGFSFGMPNGGAINRVRITPGSDEVFGPDQTVNAGSGGYAKIVRYTRVSGNPGPNQYRLVYADLPEPTDGAGNVDYSVLGIDTTGFNAQAYDPANVVSAMIQPRYKAGYLQLCSDPNVPVPGGPGAAITVRYRFQLNGSGDTFAVDYDTREIMQILLTIKNYPQSSVPNAQSITLKSTATLRNALR